MVIFQIVYRLAANFLLELPITPVRIRSALRVRRDAAAVRLQEVDRLDRLRNPYKYRGR